jgi:WD40 repeat protein
MWDTAGPREVLTFRPHDDIPVQSVVWSPDGKELATALKDEESKVWDSATGKELPVPLPPEQPFVPPDSPSPVPPNYVNFQTVSSMAWSPDGKRLALVGDLGTAVVWDPIAGKNCL